jgi:hypothetical protein
MCMYIYILLGTGTLLADSLLNHFLFENPRQLHENYDIDNYVNFDNDYDNNDDVGRGREEKLEYNMESSHAENGGNLVSFLVLYIYISIYSYIVQ